MRVHCCQRNQGRKFVYSYDKHGSQTRMEVLPVTVTSQTQLETVAASDTTRFYFDDNSNRVKLTTKAGGVYYYVYDPTASIPAVIYEQGPANRYLNIRNTDGSLITRETYDTTGTRTMSRTYHYDGLGSTIALSDEHGNVTDTYTYDAWGNVTPGEDNVTTDNPYQYVGELGYYTHYQEPGFEMLSLGVRFYDPSIGRFTQLDPIKDGVNWYGYVEGNPLGAAWLQVIRGRNTFDKVVICPWD